eukprot:TRINITY_DN17212_c0_g1_i1.p1 TRINITY_DN17212_c0_g1~~TRINITY_DN17212_c0_g1_i1.p1  ORF type:complete len:516 (+),score=72.35 TRINITY_DN17212_c0_g1_i1:68-1549(+)
MGATRPGARGSPRASSIGVVKRPASRETRPRVLRRPGAGIARLALNERPVRRKPAALQQVEPAAKRRKTSASVEEIPDNIEKLPNVFTFTTQSSTRGYGIFVDETRCMMGEESGLVVDVDRDTGEPQRSFQLPEGVKCVVGDGEYLYVGTNGGSIFDLTNGRPRLVAQIENFGQLYWIDIRDGRIAASDNQGHVGLLDCEGEVIWKVNVGQKQREGWMCRMDESGIYYGAERGVTKYNLRGKVVWRAAKHIDVAFGMQTNDHVWAIGKVKKNVCPEQALIAKINKKSGIVEAFIQVSDFDSCSVSADGSRVFDGEFNNQATSLPAGKLPHVIKWESVLWKGANKIVVEGAPFKPLSQQALGDRIYAVGERKGATMFACYDVSKSAISSAAKGVLRTSKSRCFDTADVERAERVDDGHETQETSSTDGKVVIQCVKDGGKVRARVVSPGYNASLNCQFPKALRDAGAKFVVDSVDLSPSGDFYRCRGVPLRVKS